MVGEPNFRLTMNCFTNSNRGSDGGTCGDGGDGFNSSRSAANELRMHLFCSCSSSRRFDLISPMTLSWKYKGIRVRSSGCSASIFRTLPWCFVNLVLESISSSLSLQRMAPDSFGLPY